VDFVPLTHPVLARLHGFDAGSQTRSAGSRRTPGIRLGDRLGTVPGLAAGRERISTNHGIARFLDRRHPEPPLFPADPAERRAVEEAERWANEELQMPARRIALGWAVRDPKGASRSGADGRMGYLLYRRERVRRLVIPWIGRRVFNVPGPDADHELLAQLPALLDRVDAFVRDGVLGGAQRNVADFMVASSLALILYRPDVMHLFRGRPALELVDGILPEPA
jgi:glutathione S-transferase